jgi:microcystin-dependent protein
MPRITEIPTALATPEGDAILPVVEDPDGTPTTRRIAIGTLIPAGVVWDYAGAAAPSGWLECNGQAVSRTTYARLFTAIGTTFGAGDSSTTFNVPDGRGRVKAGFNSGDTDFNAVGDTGGHKTHTLTTSQLPSHAHSGPSHTHGSGSYGAASAGNHRHTLQWRAQTVSNSNANISRHLLGSSTNTDTNSGYESRNMPTAQGAHTHSVGGTSSAGGTGNTGSTGSGSAHNNLQPYITYRQIIKT